MATNNSKPCTLTIVVLRRGRLVRGRDLFLCFYLRPVLVGLKGLQIPTSQEGSMCPGSTSGAGTAAGAGAGVAAGTCAESERLKIKKTKKGSKNPLTSQEIAAVARGG